MFKLIVAALFIGLPAHADKVGQGAGISENNIQFAYRYVDKYIQLCLAIKDCTEDGTQTDVLRKILASLNDERKTVPQIGFKRTADGIFFVDGKLRAGLTWNYVGAPIYFNLDLIYTTDNQGRVSGITLQTALALLVHELGHHQGVLDHDWLDRLGQRVSRMLDGRLFSSLLGPDRPNITASYIYFDTQSPGPAFTELLVGDGTNLYDVSGDLQALPWCGNQGKLTGLALWNFIWLDSNSASPTLLGFAKPYCLNGNVQFSPTGFGVQMKLALRWTDKQVWELDPRSVAVGQATCATQPILCGAGWSQAELSRQKMFDLPH